MFDDRDHAHIGHHFNLDDSGSGHDHQPGAHRSVGAGAHDCSHCAQVHRSAGDGAADYGHCA